MAVDERKARVGYANDTLVAIYPNPYLNSNFLCMVGYRTLFTIYPEESTEDFYKVSTAIGVEGYCYKDLVTIKF